MKVYFYKTATAIICIGFFFSLHLQQVQGQEKHDYLTLNDILAKLTFTSHINKSIEEINKQLIESIQERRVNFILTTEDEKSLKKAGANDLLIKTIHENLPKEIKGKIILYRRYIDNYKGDVSQKKIAINAAKEYIKKYSDSEDDKEIIDYFRKAIPLLESQIGIKIQT